MSDITITPEEARRARTSLYLSQSKVSDAIAMHRTKYALFEVKRYIFTEKEQLTLRKHYESLGYAFPEQPAARKPPAPKSRLIKGIAVPNRISTEKANKTLTQISQNDNYIQSKAKEIAGLHWFSEELKLEEANKIIELMAYNYTHLRWLIGSSGLLGEKFIKDMEPEKTTNGAIVNERLYR